MRRFKVLFIISFLIFSENLYSLTMQEAQLYGSRVLMCGSKQVNNWKLIQTGNKENNSSEFLIFDMRKKRTYRMEECELFYCSPEPDRMKGCIMPEWKK